MLTVLQNLTSPFATAEGQEPQRTIPAFGGPRESDDGATTSGQSGQSPRHYECAHL